MMANQLLERLEYIHSKGYLCVDVKPDNFLIGRESEKVFYILFKIKKFFIKFCTLNFICIFMLVN
jgi:serine/threonine protein kinase